MEIKKPSRIPDLVGKKFNKLTVISFYGQDKNNNSMWLCLCDCGKISNPMRGFDLKNGSLISCGCYRDAKLYNQSVTHGMTSHPLYKIWEGMKARCYIKSCGSWEYYGGRGVFVCEEWKENFMSFYNWAIDNGWQKGLQLDKDSKGIKNGTNSLCYSPETCCFVTRMENCNNRRNNHRIEYNGVSATLSEWSRLYNTTGKQIKRNLDKGWSIEESIFNKRDLTKCN